MTLFYQTPYRVNTLNTQTTLADGLVFLSVAAKSSMDIVKNRTGVSGNMDYYSFANQGLTCAGGWSSSFLADFNFTGGPFTCATYFNLSTTANESSYPDIFGQNTYSSETVNAGWNLQLTASPSWVFNTYDNNGAATYQLASSVTPVVGNHLIAGVLTSTNKYIYLDGTQSTNTNGLTILGVTSGNLQIGSQGNGVSNYWSGIWNRALSQAEITQLTYNPWILFKPARQKTQKQGGYVIPATTQQKAAFFNFFPQV